jgi:hypothetical protein
LRRAIRSFLVGNGDPSAFRLADLLRLKLGTVSEVPTPWLCLQHDLRLQGVDPAQIDCVTGRTMAENLEALRRGELDVVQMFEPYVSMALPAGQARSSMRRTRAGPTVYTTFLASRDSIRRNRAAFDAMVRATRRTLAWVVEHSAEELADAVAPYYPHVPRELLASSLQRYRDAGLWARTPEVSRAGFCAACRQPEIRRVHFPDAQLRRLRGPKLKLTGGGVMFDLIIRGGQVVTPEGVVSCDVAVAGETIAALAAPGALGADSARRVIDASAHIVMPGGIDPHVHLHHAWTKPDGTPLITAGPEQVGRAALFGGTTTFIDFAYGGTASRRCKLSKRATRTSSERARATGPTTSCCIPSRRPNSQGSSRRRSRPAIRR